MNDTAGKILATPSAPVQAGKKAKGKSKKAKMKEVEIDLKLRGLPTLKAKTTLEVEGIGDLMSGKWRLKSVKHDFSNGGYTCSAKGVRPSVGKGTGTSQLQNGESNSGSSNDEMITINTGDKKK